MNIYILIFLMMLVTYIPRALPALSNNKKKLSPYWERFLSYIPYTALAALIVPGIFYVDAIQPVVGLVGGVAAVVASLAKLPVIAVVFIAVLAEVILYSFI
ncbi:MAG: AzlD domain-containing protein [Eubacteriales bacterium]|nr:AzlD domain-containing protein [Eubacteriales bacterium]